MAQNVQVVLTCDLDEDAVEAVETVRFGNGGSSYEIEMCQQHLDEYHNWMEEYVAVARLVSKARPRVDIAPAPKARRVSGGKDVPDVSEVRQWARSNGYPVNTRGRIPATVREAFLAAH